MQLEKILSSDQRNKCVLRFVAKFVVYFVSRDRGGDAFFS